ncbi:MAG: hypothetical protein KJ970_18800 [Candidatus Eisenbacteria bacterium]|uniref:Uncharacterized protein n=1 Tax=Eiseniibacteriota bacterium TaxID=2212470 RepID=A0A948S0E2_UNCEI|nr:hypothetical protein [Candidatus Eisenbacteria bacterium]MBU1950407.1 hypothetical protein [Candidatus Eisenbacteria bacterium]MBU2692972.1 hypothetical protein [Candidatus Eisenbacteria bacterium]
MKPKETILFPGNGRPMARCGKRAGNRFHFAWWLVPLACIYFALLVQIETQLCSSCQRVEKLEFQRDSLRTEALMAVRDLKTDLALDSILPALKYLNLERSVPDQIASVVTPVPETTSTAWAALMPSHWLEIKVPHGRNTPTAEETEYVNRALFTAPGVRNP